jgi:hypothetical protein
MTQQQSTSSQQQVRVNRDGSVSRCQGTTDEVMSHSAGNR